MRGQALQRFLRSIAPLHAWTIRRVWNAKIGEELEYWRRWCATRGCEWPEDFRQRLDPETPLQPYLCDLLERSNAAKSVSILDVGAGPLTFIGRRWPGREVTVTPVDPLGKEYAALLREHNIMAPSPTLFGEAEHLTRYFPRAHFDLVEARNSLDHAFRPVKAFDSMLAVVKPGCYVHLEHHVEEGKSGGYEGLHQWDFSIDGGDFCVTSRQGRATNVTRKLSKIAEVECRIRDRDGWLVVTMKKRK